MLISKGKKKRAPTALTIKCSVCGSPAPDHLHFGGNQFTVRKKIISLCRALLLFLQSFLQENTAEDGEDRDSVQDRAGPV